jgi:uncharacterized membrane protein YfcA
METIWKALNGHKSAIGASINALLIWAIIQGFVNQSTAELIAALCTIWTGVAVGHHFIKQKKPE